MTTQSRELVFACVVLILLMALALAPVFAAPTFKTPDGSVVLSLSDDKCTNEKVMAHIKAKVRSEYQSEFRAAKLKWQDGKDYATCWIALDGMVFSIDEEGSPLNPVPYRAFIEEDV